MPIRDSVEGYERLVRGGYPGDSPNVTPESAIVGVDVDSMAGSGTCVFADFGDAVGRFWGACEGVYTSSGIHPWIPDEQAPTELREGRQRFRALLRRFLDGGYTSDMADELHDIVFDIFDGPGPYEVGGVTVLPDDLDKVLEWWRDDVDAWDFRAEIAASTNMSAPPKLPEPPESPFDLSNPEHFASLPCGWSISQSRPEVGEPVLCTVQSSHSPRQPR